MSDNWGALLIQILKFYFEKIIFFCVKFDFERKSLEKHSLIMISSLAYFEICQLFRNNHFNEK
jgi:hypothetical protein